MSSPAAHDEFRSFTVLFLLPVIFVAFAFNLWLSFVRQPWESYRVDDHHYAAIEEPDWLLADSDIDEDAAVPAPRYNSVKEGPLSPDEVSRLINIIRAEGEAAKTNSRPASPGRKRKAGDENSPVSDASSDEGPRSRKLKIQTDFGTYGRCITEGRNYGSCIHEERESDGSSVWGEYQFTFRASPPNRPIRSMPKFRETSGLN